MAYATMRWPQNLEPIGGVYNGIQDGGDDFGADMVMIIMTMVVMIVKLCHKLIKIIRKTFANEQICAGGEAGKDGCQGDSGGPFVHDR